MFSGKHQNKKMNYNIYLDESGNTGNIEIKDNLEWNYGNQPYFALGAFYIEAEKATQIEQDIIRILHEFNPELGTEKELKSKAKYAFKNELLKKVTDYLIAQKTDFYFDVANKKYKVIMNIVEYCVYPHYVAIENMLERNAKVDAANYLYKTLPEDIIKFYIDLCQDTKDEKEKIEQLMDFLKNLETLCKCNRQITDSIRCVLDFVRNYKIHGLKEEHLFPVKDFNNKGTKESFLPNVDAYNNIIGSIGKLRINRCDTINIYHDEQKQFSEVLTAWTEELKARGIQINKLEFHVSKDSILVQIADFYTGNIARIFKKIADYSFLEREDRELLKILKPLLDKCNIVAPNNEQDEFFNKCGLHKYKSPIPFLL